MQIMLIVLSKLQDKITVIYNTYNVYDIVHMTYTTLQPNICY